MVPDGLLLAGAHGITDMELNGHTASLGTTAEELVDTLVRMVANADATA